MKKLLLAFLFVAVLATAAFAHVNGQGVVTGRSADGCPAIRPGPHPGVR